MTRLHPTLAIDSIHGGSYTFANTRELDSFIRHTAEQLSDLLAALVEAGDDAHFMRGCLALAGDLAFQLRQATALSGDRT